MKKIDKRNIEDILGLAPIQEGMLFYNLKNPGTEMHREQLCLDLEGPINLLIFNKAWQAVVQANEMLRTEFRWESINRPIQVVLKHHSPEVTYADLSEEEPHRQHVLLEEIKQNDRECLSNLLTVAFHVSLCKMGQEKFKLIISNHHILYDGWSTGIILKDFFTAYEELQKRQENNESLEFSLPLKNKFKTYLQWLNERDSQADSTFWQEYLTPCEGDVKQSRTKRERRKTKHKKSTSVYQFNIPIEVIQQYEAFIKTHNITAATVLYSIWGLMLQQYHGTGDVLFDTTVAGRNAPVEGIEEMVGLFINTLPLRIESRPDENIIRLLQRNNRTM